MRDVTSNNQIRKVNNETREWRGQKKDQGGKEGGELQAMLNLKT